MRKVLYKGLTREGKWVFGTPREFVGGGLYAMHTTSNNDHDKVEHGTLCQCIGLKDKYGVNIFEGDNVKFTYHQFQLADGCMIKTVKYREDICAFTLGSSIIGDNIISMEVIGNIHNKK